MSGGIETSDLLTQLHCDSCPLSFGVRVPAVLTLSDTSGAASDPPQALSWPQIL
jgi:hypothetical protein